MENARLTETIIGCTFKVHNALGHSFLEKVYENAMRIELAKCGLKVKQQEPIMVYGEKPENPTACGGDEWQSGGFGGGSPQGLFP